MNVSLSDEWEEFVAASIESGRYNTASEVIRAALRLLQEHDNGARLERLALDAIDSGEVRKITKNDIAAVRRVVRKELGKRAGPK